MGTLTDAVREAVREAVQEMKSEAEAAPHISTDDIAELTKTTEELKERLRLLDERITKLESRAQHTAETKVEMLHSAVGDEIQTLQELRKNIGEQRW